MGIVRIVADAINSRLIRNIRNIRNTLHGLRGRRGRRGSERASVMVNYIEDVNRFKVPSPPQWFLKALWDHDSELVILPSRLKKVYLLARRRDKSLRVPMLVKIDNELQRKTRGSDADLMAIHNLVLVDTISGVIGGTWSPMILKDLKDRDMWAKGADKYNDTLLEQEKRVEDTKRAKWLGDIDHRSKDAYRSYQARTGQRNKHANDSHHKGARVYKSSSSSTAGSGLVITG